MMLVDKKKLDKMLSRYYAIGYKMGFKYAIINLMRERNGVTDELSLFINELIEKLHDEYNKYPLINKIEVPDLTKEVI